QGGNITGLTKVAAELAGKRLEILKETVPKLARVAVMWEPQNGRLSPSLEGQPATGKGVGLAAIFYGSQQRRPIRGRVQRCTQGTLRRRRSDTDGVGEFQPKADRRVGGNDAIADRVLPGLVYRQRRLDVLRRRLGRPFQTRRRNHRKNPEGYQARGYSCRAAHEVRIHHQSESRQADRSDNPAQRAGESR